MKITPEDMDDVRKVLDRFSPLSSTTPYEFARDEQRDIALALIMVDIYDRGYAAALEDKANGLL